MEPEIKEQLERLHKTTAGHSMDIALLKQEVKDHNEILGELKSSISSLQDKLSNMATSADIKELSSQINGNSISLLNNLITMQRDAINATPAKIGNWWLALTAIVAFGGLFIELIKHV